MPEKEHVALTPDQLKDLISAAVTAAVAEAKKPVVSEAQLKQIAQDQQMRKDGAESQRERIENKRYAQKMCSHFRREDGKTRAVFVENGNFMICQACHAIVRPGEAPKDYHGTDFYDDALFYRLVQAAQPVTFA